MTQSASTDPFVKPILDQHADHTDAASPSDPAQTRLRAEAAIEHLDVLIGAVAARLKRAAEEAHDDANAHVIATTPDEALQRLRATVLECAEALEQLQATQQHAREVGDGSAAQAETF